jgi:hypothetical protein
MAGWGGAAGWAWSPNPEIVTVHLQFPANLIDAAMFAGK